MSPLNNIIPNQFDPQTLFDIEIEQILRLDTLYRKAYNSISKKRTPLEAFAELQQAYSGIITQSQLAKETISELQELRDNVDYEKFEMFYQKSYQTTIEELENFNAHSEILKDVLRIILSKSYPDELELLSLSEVQKIQESKAKLGRPYDKVLDQEKLEKKVRELSKDEEFLHSDGRLKPTKVRDHLLYDPEFEDTLGRSQLFQRIKDAMDALNIR